MKTAIGILLCLICSVVLGDDFAVVDSLSVDEGGIWARESPQPLSGLTRVSFPMRIRVAEAGPWRVSIWTQDPFDATQTWTLQGDEIGAGTGDTRTVTIDVPAFESSLFRLELSTVEGPQRMTYQFVVCNESEPGTMP